MPSKGVNRHPVADFDFIIAAFGPALPVRRLATGQRRPGRLATVRRSAGSFVGAERLVGSYY